MRLLNSTPVALAALALLTAVPSVAAAQSAVEFRLQSDKERYRLGEPIVLTGTVRNRGQEALSVVPLFDPTYGFSRYLITGPDGEARSFRPPWRDEGVARPAKLRPDSEVSDRVALFRDADGSPFSKPGVYKIVGEHDGVGTSPALTLQVVEPEGRRQGAAATVLLDPDVLLFLRVGGGESLGEAREKLEQLRNAEGAPLLSAYARHGLGLYWSRTARDFSANQQRAEKREEEEVRLTGGKARAANAELARELLGPENRKLLPAHFRIEAHVALIRHHTRADDKEGARAAMADFEREFAQDARAASQLERARAYIARQ